MLSGWLATDMSMPPLPRMRELPPIETGLPPATLLMTMPLSVRPAMSLLVARFWALLESKETMLPAVGGVSFSQFPVEDQLALGVAEPVQLTVWALVVIPTIVQRTRRTPKDDRNTMSPSKS